MNWPLISMCVVLVIFAAAVAWPSLREAIKQAEQAEQDRP